MNTQHYTLHPTPYTLTIGWLYPDLMSTYGDRGNIMALQKRCEWRGISVEILPINQKTNNQSLITIDLLFGGGAQDLEQDIVMKDLKGAKASILKELVEKNIPSLFVCGAPQLMGNYYEPSVGERIEGVGIFDMYSKHPGKDSNRLIGNTLGKIYWENLQTPLVIPNDNEGSSKTADSSHLAQNNEQITNNQKPITPFIVGFENHGGRTYLGKNTRPFAKVIKGYGNNGEDGNEGVVYKNAIGCYYHGPLLPKNPHVADWLIKTALEVKYKKEIELIPLDDTLEYQAQKAIAKKLGVEV